jgi:peptide/nickel transport system permease protein
VTRFVLQRLALVVVVAIGVSTLLFALSRIGGDPAALYSPPSASDEVVAQTRERLGLGAPLVVQYLDSVASALTLDFGKSFAFQRPAFDMIIERLVPSLQIIAPALTVAVVLAFAIGTVAALRPSRFSGRAIMVGAFVTQAIPYFWVALLLVLLLAVNWQLVPATGSSGWQALVIPVFVLGVFGVSTLSRLVRGELLDAFQQDHVITARSKGVSPLQVLLRHAYPTALPPLLAWVGIQFSFMFGALLVLEPILSYNGIGGLLVRGVTGRDFPLVQAGVFFVAMFITLANVGIDVLIRLLDPRLRT